MELTPELSAAGVLLVGFVLGLTHAVEADHLAAVTAIVSEKKNIWTASIIGGLWGLGHTISLFLVGAIVIFITGQFSESTEAKLEAIVGGMLILLGINAIRKIFTRDQPHTHTHSHDGDTHGHSHTHDGEEHVHDHEHSDAHDHAHEHEGHSHAHTHAAPDHTHTHDHAHEPHSHSHLSPRSVLIGMVHGLAGSAGLMLLILPTISSTALALVYILIFGVGSIAGMMMMSLLIGLPFHFTAGKFAGLNTGIRFLAGAFSFCLGLFIVYEKLVVGA